MNYIMQKIMQQLKMHLIDAEQTNDSSIVESFISNISQMQLFEILRTYSDVAKRLSHQRYNDYWEFCLKLLLVNSHPNFQFVHSKHLTAFEFMFGYMHYVSIAEKLKHRIEKEELLAMLIDACSKHSYYALADITHSLLQLFMEKPDITDYNILCLCVKSMHNVVSQHGTPGALLIANFLFYTYKILSMKLEASITAEKETVSLQRNACIVSSFKYLEIAQLLEPSSEAEIHNYYFEQSMAVSNCYGLDNINALKKQYLQEFYLTLTSKTLQSIKRLAVEDVLQIKACNMAKMNGRFFARRFSFIQHEKIQLHHSESAPIEYHNQV